MFYFVMGSAPRTGTSMMMRCLDMGGLEAIHDPQYEPYSLDHNPDGYYELPGASPGAPEHKGKVLKVSRHQWLDLPAGKVILMLRRYDDIKRSAEKMGMGIVSRQKYYDQTFDIIAHMTLDKYVDLTVIWYEQVRQAPLILFQALKELGWPIDEQMAARGVRRK